MFRSPFSFTGRIRRQEYFFSLLLYLFLVLFFTYAVDELIPRRSETLRSVLAFMIILPSFWFLLAQGVKRSHDTGNNGWFLLIPLYGLLLLFVDGKPGVKEYGPNPKGIGNDTTFSFEQP